MPRVNRNYLIAACIFVLLTAISCSQGGPVQVAAHDSLQQVAGQDVTVDSAGLVGLAGLDAIRGAAMLHDDPIDVTAPLVERNTQVNGEFLDLLPTATELAWAVYRVDPPAGSLLSLDATGSGPLWLMVADYEQGWVFEPFEGGAASIDLTTLGDVISPEGYFYCGAVCPAGETGTLETVALHYNNLNEWNLEITTDENGVTLTWDEQPCNKYYIYRSTLADDLHPYNVGEVIEDYVGDGNTFTDPVSEDVSGRWVPENNDHGTPEDPADDFPTAAPAVKYYYRVASVIANPGNESPEVTGMIPWGDRNTAVRTLPDTTDRTVLFGSSISLTHLTEGRMGWMADNMMGCTAATQDQIDQFRAINPDFIVLGSQFNFLSCENVQTFSSFYADEDWEYHHPQIYGNELSDEDGSYPYITRHESWFLHDVESEYLHQRVSSRASGDYFPFWMDTDSPWPEYVGEHILQLTGEDGFDGWIIDNCTARTGMYPSPYEDYIYHSDFHEFVDGLNSAGLAGIRAAISGHPRRPMIVADAWTGYGAIHNYNEEPHFLDFTDCDLIFYSNYLGSNGSEAYLIQEFTDILGDEILAQQTAGRGVILSYSFDTDFYEGPFSAYCCYLMVRGAASYFNLSHYSHRPYYVVAYTWDTGAPLGPQPTCLADLRRQSVDQDGNPLEGHDYYCRDFENGTVVMGEGWLSMPLGAPMIVEYTNARKSSCDSVEEDGTTPRELPWTRTSAEISYFTTPDAGCYIIREVSAE